MAKKKPTDRIRARLGDVVEIPIKDGFAYAQYVRDSTRYSELICIYPYRSTSKLTSLDDIELGEDLYCCFFPVGIATHRGLMRIVGTRPIPKKYRRMPSFKEYNENIETKKRTWFIWDGKSAKSSKVSRLTKEQKSYPLTSILGWDALLFYVESNWRPEDEVK